MASDLGREYFPGFAESATKVLQNYHWPGNIRELKNVVERSVYRSAEPDTPVREISLDPFDSEYRPGAKTSEQAVSDETAQPGVPAPGDFPIDLKQSVQDYEVAMIKSALSASQFNQKKTAEALGVTYHQLRGLLKKYDLLESSS